MSALIIRDFVTRRILATSVAAVDFGGLCARRGWLPQLRVGGTWYVLMGRR